METKQPTNTRLTECRDCKASVSREALSCPHCGCPWPDGRPAKTLAEHRSELRKQSAYSLFRALLNAWLAVVVLTTALWIVAALLLDNPLPAFRSELWPFVFGWMIVWTLAVQGLHALLDIADAALRKL